jgi:hypothetical protein
MFVVRNQKGAIVAAYTAPQFRTQERVENHDPSLMAYLTRDPLSRIVFTNAGISVDDVALLAARTGKYVERGADEEIINATDAPIRDFQERVPLDARELVAFLKEEPPEPEPAGVRYQHAAGGWRILDLRDGSLLAEDLPSREACVTFMRGRADALKLAARKFRAKPEEV